jgi:ferrochelatase
MNDAVLLMAYGSPETLADVEAYYTHIRGGRPPSPVLLEELLERYRAIGGRSPLTDITRRQAAQLEKSLAAHGVAARVFVGMKHARPFITDVVREMAKEGITHAVSLALAPQFSRMSVGAYIHAIEEARPPSLRFDHIKTWHDHPGFVAAVAARARQAVTQFSGAPYVVFTAHSLPERILTWNDPYPAEVHRSAEEVARAAQIARWTVAYQSAGRTPDPWLRPNLEVTIQKLHTSGERAVLVCPVGFVADHLEVLYDLDVEARALTTRLGIRFERTTMLNDDPAFISALADLIGSRMRQRVI